MKHDNRGFSLVELVVAMGILLIVAAMVGGFMVSGARAYSSVSTKVSLQTKSQMLLNQLREYMVDCNTSITLNNETNANKAVIADETGGVKTTHTFWLDTSSNTLYYQVSEDSTEYVLATEVKDFKINPKTETTSGGSSAVSVVVEVTLERHGREYSDKLAIALRNKPAYHVENEEGPES